MDKRNKKKKTGIQKAIKVISIILIVLIVMALAVVAGGWTYFNNMLGEMKKETIDQNSIGIAEQTEKDLSEYCITRN